MYDKRAKDPIYYVQVGIRNGKKVTTDYFASRDPGLSFAQTH